MVRSTIFRGGALGWPKAGNLGLGSILWKTLIFGYVFDILSLIHQFRRHGAGTRKSSEVRRFSFTC